MDNLYLYFSGTGNTKFAVNEFAKRYEEKCYLIHSIEEEVNFPILIKNCGIIIIAYPIYGSDMPKIMKTFIKKYLSYFQGKSIMTLITQYMFSGDGAALAYYMLKSVNVKLLASMHINMPYNISDFKIFPVQSLEKQNKINEKALAKIEIYVEKLKQNKKIRTGRRFCSRFIGFITQRVFFKMLHTKMQKMLKINHDTCIKCMKCIDNCPVSNLEIIDNKVQTKNICTLCYRCVNICPTQSIKLLGSNYPTKQYYK